MTTKIRKDAFNAWLRKQVKRDDRVGDLAKDAIEDIRLFKHGLSDWPDRKCFPASNNKRDYINYLESRNACYGAMESFEQAWQEFLEYHENKQNVDGD